LTNGLFEFDTGTRKIGLFCFAIFVEQKWQLNVERSKLSGGNLTVGTT
jgi:hypothetical protein